MSLTASEITPIVWDGLRALDLHTRRRRVDPWEYLDQADRDELTSRVELYMAGASAEEVYTAQRDACLDAGIQLDPAATPWAELPEELRVRGDLMHTLVTALAA